MRYIVMFVVGVCLMASPAMAAPVCCQNGSCKVASKGCGCCKDCKCGTNCKCCKRACRCVGGCKCGVKGNKDCGCKFKVFKRRCCR